MNDRGAEAVEEAEETLRINPNDVDAHVALGIIYSMLRTPEEGLQEFKKAYELDPLSVVAGGMMASAAGMVGMDELEGDVLSKLLRFHPTNPRVLVGIAEYEMTRKNFDQAQRLLDDARRYGPSEPMVKFAQGELYGLSGRRKEAEAVLAEIRKDEKESARLMGELVVSTALGDLDAAFTTLMRLAEIHAWPYLVAIDPFYSELRKDPRFAEFRKAVGFPQLGNANTVASVPERRGQRTVPSKLGARRRRQVA